MELVSIRVAQRCHPHPTIDVEAQRSYAVLHHQQWHDLLDAYVRLVVWAMGTTRQA